MAENRVLANIRGALAVTPLDERLPYPAEPFVDPPAPAADDLAAVFLKEFEALASYQDQRFGAAWQVESLDEARDRIRELFERGDLHRVRATPSPLLDEVLDAALREQVDFAVVTEAAQSGTALADTDLGVTDCLCLIARTGTVVLTTEGQCSRSVSLLPPAHLVVARADQLVPDVPDAIRLLAAREGYPSLPSAYTFVSGASRTGDIERVLIVPAHGPREVFVVLLPAAG